MPIEFHCPTCQARIRTPDNSTGKKARCPQCGNVATVPAPGAPPPGQVPHPSGWSQTPAPPPQPTPPFANPPAKWPSGPSSTPSQPAPGGYSPVYPPPPAPQPGTSNPFGERTGSGLLQQQNPYASPTATYMPAVITPDLVRSRLMAPAIGLIVVGVVGLLFMLLFGVMFFVDPEIANGAPEDPAGQIGYYAVFVVFIGVGLVVHVLQVLGGVCMLRLRNYALAYSGALSALVPCNPYCCIFALPLAIWALVVLNNPGNKSAFS